MTDRRLLQTKVGKAGALLANQNITGAPIAPFTKKGWSAVQDHLRDRQVHQPIANSTTFPHNYEWDIEPVGDAPFGMYIRVEVGAITGVGAAATYTRLVDGAGIAMFPVIEIKSSQERQYRITRDYFLYYHYKHRNDWQREHDAEAVGLGLTPAERNARAASTQVFRIPIRHHWECDPSKAPILMALSEKIRISAESDTYAHLIETDDSSSTPQFTVACTLELDYLQLRGDDRRARNAVAFKGYGQKAARALLIPYVQQVPRKAVAAADTEATIDLRSLSLPTRCLVVMVRPQSAFTDYAHDTLALNESLLDNVYFRLESSGTILKSRRLVVEEIKRDHREKYAGSYAPLFVIQFEEMPLAKDVNSGYIGFNALQNPQLILEKAATFGTALYVDVFAVAHNVFIESGTRIQTMLH